MRADDDHPTEAVEALARGTGTQESNREAVRHLLAGCERCGALLEQRQGAEVDYGPVFAKLQRRAPELAVRVAEQREDADERLRELLALPRAHQRMWLANAARARSRALCEALVERSRELRHRRAGEMLRLAELAVVVADRLGAEAVSARIDAYAELGNALRIIGDHDAADQELGRAARLYLRSGTDPLQWAEVLSLLASLRMYQGRFEDARSLARKATRFFASQGDEEGVIRLLVQIAQILGREGRAQEGICALSEVFERLAAGAPSQLRLAAVHNLTHLWLEAGEPEEAARIIASAQPAFDRLRFQAGNLDRLRFDWLGARVDIERNQAWAAAPVLTRVRKEFAAEGLPFEAALVGLDLAYTLALLGRRSEQRRLASETMGLLTRLGVAPEALAAGALLISADLGDIRQAGLRLAVAAEAARRVAALREARVP